MGYPGSRNQLPWGGGMAPRLCPCSCPAWTELLQAWGGGQKRPAWKGERLLLSSEGQAARPICKGSSATGLLRRVGDKCPPPFPAGPGLWQPLPACLPPLAMLAPGYLRKLQTSVSRNLLSPALLLINWKCHLLPNCIITVYNFDCSFAYEN